MEHIWSDRRVLWLILAVYLAAMFFSPQNIQYQRKADSWVGMPHLFYGDGFRYYQMAKSLAEGRLYVYENVSDIDGPVTLSLGTGGHVYIMQSPGISLLAAPFYMLLREPGLYLLNVLLGFATCCLIYLICRLHVSEKAAAHTTLFFGLGTMVFTYSEVFYSDILSCALTAGAFYLILRHERTQKLQYPLIAGLLAGLSLLAKPTLAIVAVLLGAYAAKRCGWKAAAIFAVGFALTAWTLPAYNEAAFGRLLSDGRGSSLRADGGQLSVVDVNGPQYWANNPLKTVPLLTLLLFATQPILILSAVGCLKVRRPENILIVTVFAITAVIMGLRFDSIGGWCWSWRFMAPLIPMMALPAALTYQDGLINRRTAWILFALSAYLAFLSLAPMMWHIQSSLPLFNMVQYAVPIR